MLNGDGAIPSSAHLKGEKGVTIKTYHCVEKLRS